MKWYPARGETRSGAGRFVLSSLCLAMIVRFSADTAQSRRVALPGSPDHSPTRSAITRIRQESHHQHLRAAARNTDCSAASPDFGSELDGTEFDEVIVHDLPAGTLVVIGSLDTSAALHTIRLDAATEHPGRAVDVRASESPHSGAAEAADHHIPVLWQRPSGRDVRPDEETRTRVPRSRSSAARAAETACAGGVPRRFSVPQFVDHGVTHEARLGWIVLETNRVAVYSDRAPPATHVPDPGSGESEPQTAESAAAGRIARLMEDQVLPCVEALIGPVEDVDCDNRVSVLLTDLDRRSQPGANPVRGCVRSSDFLMPFATPSGDVLYLDRRLPEADQLTALLTHETSHAAVYSALLRHHGSQCLHEGGGPHDERAEPEIQRDMPAWLNEAIAHVLERCLVPRSENFQRRYEAFRRSPGICPIIAPEQQLTPEHRRGGTRAAATLYVESLLADRQQLQELLDFRYSPLQRLDRISRDSFAQSFRRWSLLTASGFFRDAEAGRSVAWTGRSDRPEESWPTLASGGTLELSQYGTAVSMVQAAHRLKSVRIRASRRAKLQISLLPGRDSRREAGPQTTTACCGSRPGPVAEKSL